MSENRIYGNRDRFNKNDFVIDDREGTKNCQILLEHSQDEFYNSFGIDQYYSSPLMHYTSSGTCKNSVKISSTTTNCVSKGKNELSVSNNIKNTKSRTELVFQPVSQHPGSLKIDLFASRLCHQVPQYLAWHPDPCSLGTDAMIQN